MEALRPPQYGRQVLVAIWDYNGRTDAPPQTTTAAKVIAKANSRRDASTVRMSTSS
jgi:hypothetical protein